MSVSRIIEIMEKDEVVFKITSEGLPTVGLFDGLTVKFLDGDKSVQTYYKGVWYVR